MENSDVHFLLEFALSRMRGEMMPSFTPNTHSTVPNPNGTRIYETDERGNHIGGPKYSLDWNSRVANRREGCLQWICYIAVGDTLKAAQKGLDSGIIVETGIASSSRMSKNVQAIYFDENGKIINYRKVPHAFVPKISSHEASLCPIALDLWFCEDPFDPNLPLLEGRTVQQVEDECTHPSGS